MTQITDLHAPRLTQQPAYITATINDALRTGLETTWNELNDELVAGGHDAFAFRPYTFLKIPDYAGVAKPSISTLVLRKFDNNPNVSGSNDKIVRFDVAVEVADDVQTNALGGDVETNLTELVERHAGAIEQLFVRNPNLRDVDNDGFLVDPPRVIGIEYQETNYSAITVQEGRLIRSAVLDLTVLSQ